MHHAHVRRRSGMRHLRNLWLVTGALLLGSVAPAYGAGLANGSFEEDLASWTADPVGCLTQDAVCVVTGANTFTVNAGQPDEQVISVPPLDGAKMVRLGGPFLNAGQTQTANAAASLSQTFTVDPANPALALNYNAFTWDYLGYELRFTVKVTDANGTVIAESVQRSYGTSPDTALKSTGWRSAGLDLTGYENQQVRLDISARGTEDQEGGFWAYVDAGTPPLPAVGPQQVTPVSLPGGGPVTINVFGAAGNRWIAMPSSQVAQFPQTAQFPNGCMPLELTLPIDPGSGAVSNVTLLLHYGALIDRYTMATAGPTSGRRRSTAWPRAT